MRTMEAWLGKVQREAKTLPGHCVKNLCGVWSTGAEELVKSNLHFVGLMDVGYLELKNQLLLRRYQHH